MIPSTVTTNEDRDSTLPTILGRPSSASAFIAQHTTAYVLDNAVRRHQQRERGFTVSSEQIRSVVADEAEPLILPNRQARRRYDAMRRDNQATASLLNKWEGCVELVEGETFRARLVDVNRPGLVEVAAFELDEVNVSDRPSVRPGAVFYWYIIRQGSGGSSQSILWFRRAAKASEVYIESSKKYDEMWANFGW